MIFKAIFLQKIAVKDIPFNSLRSADAREHACLVVLFTNKGSCTTLYRTSAAPHKILCEERATVVGVAGDGRHHRCRRVFFPPCKPSIDITLIGPFVDSLWCHQTQHRLLLRHGVLHSTPTISSAFPGLGMEYVHASTIDRNPHPPPPEGVGGGGSPCIVRRDPLRLHRRHLGLARVLGLSYSENHTCMHINGAHTKAGVLRNGR